MRPSRVAHLRMSGEDRAHDLDLAEHRRGEDVEPGAVREQQLGDVASAHVGRGSEPRLPVAVAPVPGRIREGRVPGQRVADRLEIAVGVGHEFTHEVAVECGRRFASCHV